MSIKVEGGSVVICPLLEQSMQECQPHCKKELLSYEGCVERLGPEPPKGKTCEMQYFDYYRCLDHCVRIPRTRFSSS